MAISRGPGGSRRAAPSLPAVYDLLLARYGPQHWWPAESDFEMIVGAFLVQNTSWRNVEKAMAALRATGWLTPEAIRDVDEGALAERIRSAGAFRQKARRLKAFVAHLFASHRGHLQDLFDQGPLALRAELLALNGVGPETADSIVLYAARRPIFIADAYTRRLFDRLGVLERPSYDAAQRLAHADLPADSALYNEFHALIVRHAVVHCRATPVCPDCPLSSVCSFAAADGETEPRRR